jgi:hypothetical protein
MEVYAALYRLIEWARDPVPNNPVPNKMLANYCKIAVELAADA